MHNAKQIQIGDHQVFVSETPYTIEDSAPYEDLAAQIMASYPKWRMPVGVQNQAFCRNSHAPSPILSMRLFGNEPNREDVYQVSCDTREVGIAHLAGSNVATALAQKLRSKGYASLAAHLSPERAAEQTDFDAAIKAFEEAGIKVLKVKDSLSLAPSDYSTWACITPEEFHRALQGERQAHMKAALERSVFWPFENGNGTFALEFGGVRLSEITSDEELDARYPRGFVVRRLRDTRARTKRYHPEPSSDTNDQWYLDRMSLQAQLKMPLASEYAAFPLRSMRRVQIQSERKRREYQTIFFIFHDGRYVLQGGYATCLHKAQTTITNGALLTPIHVTAR